MNTVKSVPVSSERGISPQSNGTHIILRCLAGVRRPPFATPQQEADAIDAKVFALKLKSKHLAYYQRTTRLSNLIADGMKAAAHLRVNNNYEKKTI